LFLRETEEETDVYQRVLRDEKFLAFLAEVDADLASTTRAGGCPACGGVLDSASFPRKPRALGELGDGYGRRSSFCCRVDGCRRRRTPPSVRFLGRKVYIAAVVVLATAMQHGPTARRVAELQALLGIGRRTLARWQRWWREIFAASPSWRANRALVGAPCVETATFPLSLLERFDGDERGRVLGVLRFIAPVIAESGF
jgi:hypothetical protein